jgi:hypothetical protein
LNYTTNANLKDHIKVEVVLVEENYELIQEVEYFKKLKVDRD